MAEKTYPPGVPCWIDCQQPDVDAAADFYRGLFGWVFDDRLPPGSPDRYLIGSLDGAEILGMASGPGSGPARWRTYIAVTSADDTLAAAVAAGATAVGEPDDAGPAGRSASLLDPTGAAIELWEPRARKGAAVVNAPGTWNWSDLHTPDRDAAVAFYTEVFAWKAATVPGLGTMWQRPGYGDHLARADPTLRERHAADGVPEGFSDAIAWLLDDDGPSRWHVTFAHDDPDGIAARATELGGRVVSEPESMGPVRLATVADPAGAPFTVSRYSP